ncbi:hypothetical protein KBX06_21940 [Micromonospora sp. C31]|uniref:hypothetical protein n=1 Tax=Micromonospora sp. C31 TaxID=2824876 RepID=UPI001B380AA2|nr:hypothetical protein [Micromonospora sp. C31]
MDGRREPGRPHNADAYARNRRARDGFVWLGLHEPDPTVPAMALAAFTLHRLFRRSGWL